MGECVGGGGGGGGGDADRYGYVLHEYREKLRSRKLEQSNPGGINQ